MTLQAKRATASVQPSDGPGEFDLVLSNGALDRDGEVLSLSSWKQPLPDTVPINANHSADVAHIVGSGRPFFDSEGNLRVTGTFATTPLAQEVRTLVTERHLRSVSVEFLRHKDGNGRPVNELVGGAFVNVPSNPTARVLTSKEWDEFSARLHAILSGQPDDALTFVTKAAYDSPDAAAMVTAIHDAAVHLGAQCMPVDSDGAEKAAALRLRLKALRR